MSNHLTLQLGYHLSDQQNAAPQPPLPFAPSSAARKGIGYWITQTRRKLSVKALKLDLFETSSEERARGLLPPSKHLDVRDYLCVTYCTLGPDVASLFDPVWSRRSDSNGEWVLLFKASAAAMEQNDTRRALYQFLSNLPLSKNLPTCSNRPYDARVSRLGMVTLYLWAPGAEHEPARGGAENDVTDEELLGEDSDEDNDYVGGWEAYAEMARGLVEDFTRLKTLTTGGEVKS